MNDEDESHTSSWDGLEEGELKQGNLMGRFAHGPEESTKGQV